MQHFLSDLEKARVEAEQIFAEGAATGLPLAVSRLATQVMLKERNVTMPPDLLAWVSKGRVRDGQVTNWASVTGA